jgi:transposase
LLRKWLLERQVREVGAPRPVKPPPQYSIPDLVFCVLRRTEECTPAEGAVAAALRAMPGVVGQSCQLSTSFARLVREQDAAGWEAWVAAASASASPEWARFVNGLQRDAAAVRAALSEPWSQGAVEGHVHRLKLIKRAMYGRGSFELLRKRVLLAA